ncbi:ricin-type beta-trefoil lectin domain protein [Streptomyces collinus]|uniref:ricin-type beta-trefoil lectin domain protein n=1 Tax=Streptomyces collinus TaxID=42684 RepID=UPI003627CA68
MKDAGPSESAPGARRFDASDEELSAELKQWTGTAPALSPVGELLDRHWEAAFAYARLCTDGPRAAGMLTTAAFTRLFGESLRQAGPSAAWRPHLLVTVRRIAAEWENDGRQELLHPALRAAPGSAERAAARMLPPPGRRLLSRAFQRLPQAARAVLWHTEVETEPLAVPAALLGLDEEETLIELRRAHERLREECLQAHRELAPEAECRKYLRMLDVTYRRGGVDVDPDLQGHLAGCRHCRQTADQLARFNAGLGLALAEAVLGWGARAYLESRAARTEQDTAPGPPPAPAPAAPAGGEPFTSAATSGSPTPGAPSGASTSGGFTSGSSSGAFTSGGLASGASSGAFTWGAFAPGAPSGAAASGAATSGAPGTGLPSGTAFPGASARTGGPFAGTAPAGPENPAGGAAPGAGAAGAGAAPRRRKSRAAGARRATGAPGTTGPGAAGGRLAHRAARRARRRNLALAVVTVSGLVVLPLVLWSVLGSGGDAAPAPGATPSRAPGKDSPTPGPSWAGASGTAKGALSGRLRNATSGLCVGVVGGKAVRGAETELATCSSTASQQWTYETDGLLRNSSAPGLCLDSHLGYSVRLAPCAATGGAARDIRYDFTLQGALIPRSDQDLALTPAATDGSGALVLKNRAAATAQRWTVDAAKADLRMEIVDWDTGDVPLPSPSPSAVTATPKVPKPPVTSPTPTPGRTTATPTATATPDFCTAHPHFCYGDGGDGGYGGGGRHHR